jgi:hypothetical protein
MIGPGLLVLTRMPRGVSSLAIVRPNDVAFLSDDREAAKKGLPVFVGDECAASSLLRDQSLFLDGPEEIGATQWASLRQFFDPIRLFCFHDSLHSTLEGARCQLAGAAAEDRWRPSPLHRVVRAHVREKPS